MKRETEEFFWYIMVKFVQAVDENGLFWGTPYSFAESSFYGAPLSVAIVEGRPAICYSDRSANVT